MLTTLTSENKRWVGGVIKNNTLFKVVTPQIAFKSIEKSNLSTAKSVLQNQSSHPKRKCSEIYPKISLLLPNQFSPILLTFPQPIHRNFSQQTAQVFHVKNGIIRKVIVSVVAQLDWSTVKPPTGYGEPFICTGMAASSARHRREFIMQWQKFSAICCQRGECNKRRNERSQWWALIGYINFNVILVIQNKIWNLTDLKLILKNICISYIQNNWSPDQSGFPRSSWAIRKFLFQTFLFVPKLVKDTFYLLASLRASTKFCHYNETGCGEFVWELTVHICAAIAIVMSLWAKSRDNPKARQRKMLQYVKLTSPWLWGLCETSEEVCWPKSSEVERVSLWMDISVNSTYPHFLPSAL